MRTPAWTCPLLLVTALGGAVSGIACNSGNVGKSCTSSAGLPGMIVADQTNCYVDDAFCEPRGDGHYCTGAAPATCPLGQVRAGWGCAAPGGAGGGASSAGGGGSGGSGAAQGGTGGPGGGGMGGGAPARGGSCGTGTAPGGTGGVGGSGCSGDVGRGTFPSCQAILNSAGLDTGFETCDDGTSRRRAALTCPLPPMNPPDAGVTSASCGSDSDCGIGGVCADAHNLRGYSGCWTGCRQDADCGAGSICACGDIVGRCVPASCTTNADCGTGFGCVATGDGRAGACTQSLNYPSPSAVRYVCQRTSDTCWSSGDCESKGGPPSGLVDGGAYSSACLYDGTRRVCGYICAGPV